MNVLLNLPCSSTLYTAALNTICPSLVCLSLQIIYYFLFTIWRWLNKQYITEDWTFPVAVQHLYGSVFVCYLNTESPLLCRWHSQHRLFTATTQDQLVNYKWGAEMLTGSCVCTHADTHTHISTLICLFRSMHMLLHMTQMLQTVGWNDGWRQKPQSPSRCLIWLQAASHSRPCWWREGIRERTDGRAAVVNSCA